MLRWVSVISAYGIPFHLFLVSAILVENLLITTKIFVD